MSFDALATSYRALEFVLAGNLLHRCRTAFLAEATRATTALLLGEGPGRYLVEILRVNPTLRVVCLDSSAQMLKVARRRLLARGLSERHVQFACADWSDWAMDSGPFDLVATHFFLDCFRADQIAALVHKVASATSTRARWVLSDFREPGGGWERIRARALLKLAYLFFRWATNLPAARLTPPDLFLEANGFRLVERRLFNHGLLHADLWQA